MSKIREEASKLHRDVVGIVDQGHIPSLDFMARVVTQTQRVRLLLDKLESLEADHNKWGNYILADEIAEAIKKAEEV